MGMIRFGKVKKWTTTQSPDVIKDAAAIKAWVKNHIYFYLFLNSP